MLYIIAMLKLGTRAVFSIMINPPSSSQDTVLRYLVNCRRESKRNYTKTSKCMNVIEINDSGSSEESSWF